MMQHPARTLRISLLLALAVLAGAAIFAGAQTDTSAPPTQLLDETDLEQLVAPVALYPDPLLAQLLPAATYPDEVQSAAAWLAANPNPPENVIDAQPYDPPVQALLHYPTVLQMMSDQIDWTQQLGVAFLNQPTDVMNAIQQLRQRAMSAGALVSGPQIQVYSDADGIQILPADQNVVCVPQYDPNVLYVGDGGTPWVITWGPTYPCGVWLSYNFDWHNHWVGEGRGWNHGWPRPGFGPGRGPVMHPWVRNNARPLPVYRPGDRGFRAPPAGRPVPPAFDAGQKRIDVQRDQDQGDRRPPPAPPVRPAPAPRPVPPPRPAPAPPRPAPAPAFHPDNNRNAAADSARGHASMGGGGAHGGGRK